MKIATKKVRDNGTLAFQFANGQEVVVNPETLPLEIQTAAMLHGLSQKLGDSYANAQGDVEWAYNQFLEVFQNIQAGDWNRKATGDGGMLADAIAEVQGIPRDEVVEKLRDMDDETKSKLRKHPQIAAKLAAIKLERAEKKAAQSDAPDLSDLF